MEQFIDVSRVEQLVNLFGNFDENIKIIEKEYGVKITSHSENIRVSGNESGVQKAVRALGCLIMMV